MGAGQVVSSAGKAAQDNRGVFRSAKVGAADKEAIVSLQMGAVQRRLVSW
jgi:hypothetical protein